ncbi:Aim36p PWA37_003503 [Arxiozyma heterogenica]|uniref:Aim36p n=1 Tax=Arxiozyma heterogenica TaxID=278026 RepID=UPI002EFF2702
MIRVPTRQLIRPCMNQLIKPLTLIPLPSFSIMSKRWFINQSSSNKRSSSSSTTKRDVPSFRNIILMALVGTGIFVFTVNSLDRTQKKTTFSDIEYTNMMKGLRRRVTLFTPGEIDVNLLYFSHNNNSSTKKILDQLNLVSNLVIDPFEVIESFRNDSNGRYEAILNDIKSVYGNREYIYHLPDRMLVSLLRDYIKEHCQVGDKITILDFPSNMSDAMDFENEISEIKQIYIPKDENTSDICKYFETVDKVTLI